MDGSTASSNLPYSSNTPHALDSSTSDTDGATQQSFDNRSFCRQKRRRTSPQDQMILEAAYKNDPKPDKAARLELVKQTSLGEKEVQEKRVIATTQPFCEVHAASGASSTKTA
ncbi:uncharacterized protein MYCFIDRAFT_76128 [Pseudocercospora fijiensis CIRAD86]|uniref:Homeobox domain-containing protein n=1 Tax=Pseudocercospora fijiensis (strain CIRAD86) TaxID=383855 RepID=N1QB16_PSEFD|nr:uncharacterized protein MYCFIDRAFT_76128 [Pseudocercospora fijiensis CIRAD86]EME88302.1 hypothetical protein MYCFIDRAFT_76128 [Pseudocercospora fijiensis CIRAD86]